MTHRSSEPRGYASALGSVLCLVAAAGCGDVSGSASDGGLRDATSEATTTAFAPYFYTWGWGSPSYAFTTLAEMKSKGGPAAVTLAFVISAGGCHVSTDIEAERADIQAYLAAGGHVKVSFGGATGTYLESACPSATALAAELGRFVDATGLTDLDFDLEQHALSSNPPLNLLRATALKQLQDTRNVRIAFTLPVAPGGLLQESVDILQAAITAGVSISLVNGMTMDYGNGTDLATTPSRSIDGLALQLQRLFPGKTLAQAYRMAGATAMIGKNDDDETFSLDNARTLVAYTRQHQLALVSFWAIQRDQPCGASTDLNLCSRLDAATFDFAAIFAGATQPP